MDSHNSNSNKLFGYILIAASTIYLFNYFDLISSEAFEFFKSLGFIFSVLGLYTIYKKAYYTGTILLAVGIYLILIKYFDAPDISWKLIVPIILIFIGIKLVLRKRIDERKVISFNEKTKDDFVDQLNVFGGSKSTFTSKSFKGGKIKSFFGGSEIDLRDCDIDGSMAAIEVTAVFGGNKILVPSNWELKIEVDSIFGGVGDKRFNNNSAKDKTLVIKGFAIFGGIEIM